MGRYSFMQNRQGDIVKVEIRDSTYRTIYKKTFNINDRNSWWELIQATEKFGFSVIDLIKQKLRISEHF